MAKKKKTSKKKGATKKRKTTKKRAKKRPARRKAKKKAKRVGRPRGRRSRLSSVSLAELKAEMERRQRDLLNERTDLQQQIEQIDRELSDLGVTGKRRPGRPSAKAPGRGGPGRRRRGKVNLVDSLRAVLNGRTMGVAEVAEAVQRAGYKTKSKNFRTIVNLALIKNPGKFKKVARGQYTAK